MHCREVLMRSAFRKWSMECGQDAYVDLMKRYPMVTDAFLRLKTGYQKVRLTAMGMKVWACFDVLICSGT